MSTHIFNGYLTNDFEECKIVSLYNSILQKHQKKPLKINLKKYFSRGVEQLYSSILNSKFEPNSHDTIILLVTLFLFYGENSQEYKNVYEYIYKGCGVDCGWIDIVIEGIKSHKKIFIDPVLEKDGSFLNEKVDPNCYQIKESGVIALLSDWAIGTDSSINTLEYMSKHKPDYFIHLGDVYYSGTVDEFKKNLIEPIQNILPPHTKTFIIPGNHDYYSGTDGLHYALRKLNQTSSFFSLYNSKIQIEGLDTGFNDSDLFYKDIKATFLQKSEEEWHANRFKEARKSKRKVVLLSHHQIISNINALDRYNTKKSPLNHKLFSQTKDVLDITEFWFFGHDHSFNIFEPYRFEGYPIYRPRLIGNGSCQSRESSLETYAITSVNKEAFETDPKIVYYPRVKNVIPEAYNKILNNSYVIIKYSCKSMKVTYYEIPMIELGKFDKPKILYYEKISF